MPLTQRARSPLFLVSAAVAITVILIVIAAAVVILTRGR
jgi:hypothetical protein